MHKSATKCNETICKWCKNKHGASKIIDTLETYHWFPEFKSKGIEFEVGDKYVFWQLTGLLIRQSCQACSLKPLARYYNENKSKYQVEDLKI
jgi:hypothetical protein